MSRPVLWSKVAAFGFGGGLAALAGTGLGYLLYYSGGEAGATIRSAVSLAIFCVLIIAVLAMLQNWYLWRRIALSPQNWLALLGAAAMALGVSLLSGGIAAFPAGVSILHLLVLGLGLAWLAAGLIPNTGRFPILLLTGVAWPLFTLLSLGAGSSIVGILIFNALKAGILGLSLPLIECRTAKAWLEFEGANSGEQRLVNLGLEPVAISGDGQIRLAPADKFPDLVLRYRQEQGQIVCDDFISQVTEPIEIGKQRQVANSRIITWGNSAWGNSTSDISASPASSLSGSSPSGNASVATAVKVAPAKPKIKPDIKPNVKPYIPPLGIPAPTPPNSKPCSQYTLQLSNGLSLTLKQGLCLTELDLRGLESAHPDQHTVAEVNSHPQHPEMLGLKNYSLQTWQLTLPNEPPRPIEPGRSARLSLGNQIKFVDFMEGEVTS